MTEYELKHYGVKGMRWGVRKDANMLANHRRNDRVFDAKNKYKQGLISKEERKSAIRAANKDLKLANKEFKSQYKTAKAQGRKKEFKRNVKATAKTEIRNRGALNVAGALNSATTVGMLGSAAASGMAMMALYPPMAGIAMSTMVAGSAVTAGKHWLINRGIDKLS